MDSEAILVLLASQTRQIIAQQAEIAELQRQLSEARKASKQG